MRYALVLASLVASCTAPSGDKPETATTLSIASGTLLGGYLPTSVEVATTLTVTANPEAAGLPVTVTTTNGTLVGASGLLLDSEGAMLASATLAFDTAMSAPGSAVVVAQAFNVSSELVVELVAPPTLVPAGGPIAAGGTIEVAVSNTLPSDEVAGSIEGCSVVTGPGTHALENQGDISGAGLTPLTTKDMSRHPTFQITADQAAASGTTVDVTCLDVYEQRVTATFTVTP